MHVACIGTFVCAAVNAITDRALFQRFNSLADVVAAVVQHLFLRFAEWISVAILGMARLVNNQK